MAHDFLFFIFICLVSIPVPANCHVEGVSKDKQTVFLRAGYIYNMRPGLVSVVLCCYNGEKYLVPQVESILRQTYSPFELIISDDASTDATRELLKTYEQHPQVRIFYHEENMGLTRNFEFASQQANGEWIAFSDQDDVWMNNKIETLVASIGEKPLVYSDSLLVNEQGGSLGKKLSDLKRMYTGDDSRGYILYSCVWGHGMMVTRRLLQQAMPMPAHINHDIWLTYQAFLHGGIQYVDEVLTHYRQHQSSYSRTLPPKRIGRLKKEKRYKAYKEKQEWIQLMGMYERPQYRHFYSEFSRLFGLRERRRYVFPLVWFMLRHRKAFFLLSKKGLADNIIEILKYGLGERPVR